MNAIDKKISAFVKRYVKAIRPEELAAASERNRQMLLATVKELKEGRLAEPAARLKPCDDLVLAAVYLPRGQGCSVSITAKVTEISEERLMVGDVYAALDRLERRDL